MNYYQHHLGDYAAATVHLSWDEDCAYRRLLDQYYKREAPIPADLSAACRLARAATPVQRSAVQAVLREFFTLTDAGWVQPHAQAAIAMLQDGQPDRQALKEHRHARVVKHREERAELFAALAAAGQRPSWNVTISELRALAKRFCNAAETPPVTETVTETVTGLVTRPETPETISRALPVTTPETPATATHSHKPITKKKNSESESITATTAHPDTDQARGKIPRAVDALRERKQLVERGTRVPEPFEITDEMRTWAQEHTPHVDLVTATAEFVDYWRGIPGARGRKLDWAGTWRNRMRDVAARGKRNGADHGQVPRKSRQLTEWEIRKEALKNA